MKRLTFPLLFVLLVLLATQAHAQFFTDMCLGYMDEYQYMILDPSTYDEFSFSVDAYVLAYAQDTENPDTPDYVAYKTGERGFVIASLDGSFEHYLPDGLFRGMTLQNGLLIFAYEVANEQNYAIYNPFVAPEEMLTSYQDGSYPSWGPDGQYAVSTSRGLEIFVYGQEVAGGRLITNTYSGHAEWSPDGSMIAYNEVVAGIIHIVDAETLQFVASMESESSLWWGIQPTWIDNNSLYASGTFHADSDQYLKLYKINPFELTIQLVHMELDRNLYEPQVVPCPVYQDPRYQA